MKDINYALMLIKANKLDGAKDLLEELLKSDPQDKDILYNLGMCYTELDEPERAVEILSECVRCYPNYSNAYVALGFAHSRLAEQLIGLKIKDNLAKAFKNNIRIMLVIDDLSTEQKDTLTNVVNAFKLENGEGIKFIGYVVRFEQKINLLDSKAEYALSMQ